MKKRAFTLIEIVIVLAIMIVMAFFVWKYIIKNSDTARSTDGIRHELDTIVHNAIESKKDNSWGTFEDVGTKDFVSYFPQSYNPQFIDNYVQIESITWKGCIYQIKHNQYGESMSYRVFMDCSKMPALKDDSKAVMETKAKKFFEKIKPKAKIYTKATNIDDTEELSGTDSDGMILINDLN